MSVALGTTLAAVGPGACRRGLLGGRQFYLGSRDPNDTDINCQDTCTEVTEVERCWVTDQGHDGPSSREEDINSYQLPDPVSS